MKNILVAPLNWGLGHATRCIPLIRELTARGAGIHIASDGGALLLLRKEFPKAKFHELPSYDIDYSGSSMTRAMLRQSAGILKTIVQEHESTRHILKENTIHGIISDNRFGLWHSSVPSVFMTHQTHILAPNKILDLPVNSANHFLMDRFTEVWIPDFQGEKNLAGTLAHKTHLDNQRFIGPLTRLEKRNEEKVFDVLAVLSGPEPGRTELERKIFEQAIRRTEKFLVVRGQPERWEYFNLTPNVEVVSFLTTTALNDALYSAPVLISRSGYSTLMDLWKTERHAILVPTPGQTEQEYLAERFMEQGAFFSQTQEGFDLDTALEKWRDFPGLRTTDYPEPALGETLDRFLASL